MPARVLLLLALTVLPTGARSAIAADPAVEMAIANAGDQPLRCMILFGHWVTQDVGPIAPGGSATISMWRGAPSGALYIPRFDGRKMMIENVICGSQSAWSDTFDQIQLLPIRDSAGSRFTTACKAAGRVSCSPPTNEN